MLHCPDLAAWNSVAPTTPSLKPDGECFAIGFILSSDGLGILTNNAYKKLCERLVAARGEANLTQVELSFRLKRPQSFVSKYERGERCLDVIEFGEVARALGINPIRILSKFYREIL